MISSGEPSFPHPLGVNMVDGGVDVALYSDVAERVSFFNAYWGPVAFRTPNAPVGAWAVTLDTTPEDGAPAVAAPLGSGVPITVGPRSLIIATG